MYRPANGYALERLVWRVICSWSAGGDKRSMQLVGSLHHTPENIRLGYTCGYHRHDARLVVGDAPKLLLVVRPTFAGQGTSVIKMSKCLADLALRQVWVEQTKPFQF